MARGRGLQGSSWGPEASLTQALAFPEAMSMALGVPFSAPLLTTADGALAGCRSRSHCGLVCVCVRLWDPSGH